MEELKKSQNELNDILIKRESSEGGSLKNILLVVAALLLFIIIGILAFRIIDSGAKDEVTPAQKSEPVSKYGAASAPEVENSNKTLEDILAKHRSEKEAIKSDEVIDKMVVEEKIDLNEPSKFVEIKDEKPQAALRQPESKPADTKPVEPKKIEPKQPEPKKNEPKAPAAADGKKGHFFVQVESLEKEPRADYIKELKSKGFGVVVKEKVIDGKKKKRVYVGPYNTKEEAAAVLPKIKSEINPDAFVIQD